MVTWDSLKTKCEVPMESWSPIKGQTPALQEKFIRKATFTPFLSFVDVGFKINNSMLSTASPAHLPHSRSTNIGMFEVCTTTPTVLTFQNA